MACTFKEPMLAQVIMTIHQHCHCYLSSPSVCMVSVIAILALIDVTAIATIFLVVGTY